MFPARRRPNKRTLYDPAKHCGAPKDRSEATLRLKIERYQVKIAELDSIANERPFNKSERFLHGRYTQRIGFAQQDIDKLNFLGPDDRPCMRRKGFDTTHPGVGYCKGCCECKGRPDFHLGGVFQYSQRAKDKGLRRTMDRMEAAGTDLLDIMPETLLLKATVQRFIDSVMDNSPETIKSLTILNEQIRKNIEMVNNRKFQSMIALEVFEYALFRMGEVVEHVVKDPELLDEITRQWQRIQLDTTSKKHKAINAGRSSVG